MYFKENLNFLSKHHPDFVKDLAEINAFRMQELRQGDALPIPDELIQISRFFDISVDRLLKVNLSLRKHAENIRLVVFDIDGVLTDGGMYYTESGDEFKKFNSKDGLAIRRLAKEGYLTGVISHGINVNLITRRANLLNIPKVYVGNRPKEEVLLEWCHEIGIQPLDVAYIGDDINDLPVMKIAGFTACPADAVQEVKKKVDVVLGLEGGKGCVREWIDEYILKV